METSDPTQSNPSRRPGECDAAALFNLLWLALSDLLGTAATATLIRRSIKRAAVRAPELLTIAVSRERFEYRCALPPGWNHAQGLRELARELGPLLFELTGPVVIQRLRGIPELERSGVFSLETES